MTAVQPTEVEITPDQTQLWVHFSHQAYEDFGRTENLQFWKLAKVFESARYYGLELGDMHNLFHHPYTSFVLGMRYNFNPHLWSVRRGTSFPFKVSYELTDVGRTSMTISSRMVNKLDNQEMSRATCKMVYVDGTTRRPTPYPDWFIQKCTSSLVKKRQPFSLPLKAPQMPTSATGFIYQATVAPSDTDRNGHTNQASYVKFCCDAVQVAVRAGRLVGFEADIGRYPLKEQEVVYSGESVVGDKLQVLLWQQPGRLDYVHYVISHQGDNKPQSVIFHAHMIFGMHTLKVPFHRL